MLRCRKGTSENLKNWEASSYLSNFKFSRVIYDAFCLKVKLIWNKKLYFEGIYHTQKKKQ